MSNHRLFRVIESAVRCMLSLVDVLPEKFDVLCGIATRWTERAIKAMIGGLFFLLIVREARHVFDVLFKIMTNQT